MKSSAAERYSDFNDDKQWELCYFVMKALREGAFRGDEGHGKETIMTYPSIKEMPAETRPYEKFRRFGAAALSDAELLAILIRSGTRQQSALEVAQNVISAGGNSLAGIGTMSLSQLTAVPGIGEVKAVQLQCILELAGRAAKAKMFSKVHLLSAESIADYYMESMQNYPQEHIVVAMFDSAMKLMHDETIAVGTVNAAFITPREIFRSALRSDAVSIVLLHNHPSGDPTPSKDDITFTMRIEECGKWLGIPLMDHIIIGCGTYISLRHEKVLSE